MCVYSLGLFVIEGPQGPLWSSLEVSQEIRVIQPYRYVVYACEMKMKLGFAKEEFSIASVIFVLR